MDTHSHRTEATGTTDSILDSQTAGEEDRGTIAFCLFKYFPYGGLQRDFLQIALEIQARGYRIRVYTLTWQGDIPEGFEVVLVPVKSLTNHGRYKKYHAWLSRHLRHQPVQKVVGFNKIPGLDIYFAADPCYEHMTRTRHSRLYRLLPRYKLFSNFEGAVFDADVRTEIMMLSAAQIPVFVNYYGTQEKRFHLLPPGITKDRIATSDKAQIRRLLRAEFGIADDEILLLMVGSGFVTKGLDRALIALASLPDSLLKNTRLIAIGQDAPRAFLRLATSLGVRDRIEILRGREDIPRFLMAADLLLHPAYTENSGTVLLEASVAGLPVLATDICGYAHYVEEVGTGKLIPSPFRQERCNAMLQDMLISPEREVWSANGIAFAKVADIFNMHDQAADLITAEQAEPAPQLESLEITEGAYIADELRGRFSEEHLFDQVAALQGEMYRDMITRRTLRFTEKGNAYFAKVHFGVGWLEIFKNLVQGRLPVISAANEWRALRHLAGTGIDTLEPVLYCKSGWNPAAIHSCIITRSLDNTISLEDLMGEKSCNKILKRKLITRIAEIAKIMHTRGINHRDFYLCHFFLDRSGQPDQHGGRLKLSLIDLHRAQIRRRTPMRWRVKDIGELLFSALEAGLTKRDLLRFIRSYLPEGTSLRASLSRDRVFWNRVQRRAVRLYLQDHDTLNLNIARLTGLDR